MEMHFILSKRKKGVLSLSQKGRSELLLLLENWKPRRWGGKSMEAE